MIDHSDTPGDQSDVAINVDRIEKIFEQFSFGLRRSTRRRRVTALRGVSFQLRKGEMVGLLGPNGAGKTTLLKIIATLLYPSSGTVRFFGRDHREYELESRGLLGLITCDERSFYWRLSGRTNLRFFATLYGLPSRQADARIDELLHALDLSEAADRRFDGYSAGMKQKLAIARGLLNQPQILLYDEPTRSLDPLSQHTIRHWIRENRKRNPSQSHLLATHNLLEAEQLCDRVIIVSGGAIVADGTVDKIRAYFRDECVAHVIRYASAEPIPDVALAATPGVVRIESIGESEAARTIRLTADADGQGLSAVLAMLIESGGSILSCDTQTASLEDLFCSLVEDSRAEAPAAAGSVP